MAANNNTSRVYVKLCRRSGAQFNFPTRCVFKRYKYLDDASSNSNYIYVDELNTIANHMDFDLGINLNFNEQPHDENRYRLFLSVEDNQGLNFKCVQPIMLTHEGNINLKLPVHLNTFYLKLNDG